MIDSIFKRIHTSGIIEVGVNTIDKWVSYQINRYIEEHKIVMSFFTGEDEDPVETVEYIDMHEDFNPFDYMIYDNQCKDQIMLILVPRNMLMKHEDWKKY